MIDCVNTETAHLFGDALPAQFRLRHRIFVERQRWNLSSFRGMEYDQYDTPATQYLIWRELNGEARGIARLNPTDRPYMFKEIFADHFEVDDIPSAPDVWEGTRFGVDRGLDAGSRNRIIAELLCACLEYGLSAGIRQYLVLMPLVVLKRTFPNMGCKVEDHRRPEADGARHGRAGAVRRLPRNPGECARQDRHPAFGAEDRRRI